MSGTVRVAHPPKSVVTCTSRHGRAAMQGGTSSALLPDGAPRSTCDQPRQHTTPRPQHKHSAAKWVTSILIYAHRLCTRHGAVAAQLSAAAMTSPTSASAR